MPLGFFFDDDFEDDLGVFAALAGVACNSTLVFIQKEDSNNKMLMSACGGWAALQRLELCRVTECHAAQRSATLLSSSPTECPCSTILQAAQPTSAPCIFPGLRMFWAGYQCTVPLMPRFVGANKTSAFSQCSPTDLVAARGQSRQHASRRGAHWQ